MFRSIIVSTLVYFVVTVSIAFANDVPDFFYEEVIHYKTAEKKSAKEKRNFTEKEIRRINGAKAVVKRYWASSYEDRYNLFSEEYKERLRKEYKVHNAFEYKKSMPKTEMVWLSHTYQSFVMHSDNLIEIVVLGDWSEEGFEGKRYYYFDMVYKEGKEIYQDDKRINSGEWKINKILN